MAVNRYIIPGFEHRVGYHCGSTAMCDLLRYYGVQLDEADCFGLGSGLHFMLVHHESLSPSCSIHGRLDNLEPDLAKTLGFSCDHRLVRKGEDPWQPVKELLLARKPVILIADIAYLGYYNTDAHFTAHRILCVGFDEEKEAALIADNAYEELQEVPLVELNRARSSQYFPFPLNYDYLVFEPIESQRPFEAMASEALLRTCNNMIDKSTQYMGVGGILSLSRILPQWKHKVKDWKFSARFNYQIIQKRGTGGALFRNMFRDFFYRTAFVSSWLDDFSLKKAITDICLLWTDIAYGFRELSETGSDKMISLLESKAMQVYELERWFFEHIKARLEQ